MPDSKKPKDKAAELEETVKESVDFRHKHVDAASRRAKLEMARKWLRSPLEDFLAAMEITEDDPRYDEIVAIWRSFHD